MFTSNIKFIIERDLMSIDMLKRFILDFNYIKASSRCIKCSQGV